MKSKPTIIKKIKSKTWGYAIFFKCKTCKNLFRRALSNSGGKNLFCSKQCQYKLTRKKVRCLNCNNFFKIAKSIFKQGRKHCSRLCKTQNTNIFLKCLRCKKSFNKPQSLVYKTSFCSKYCKTLFEKGKNASMYGKKHSKKTRKQMSKSAIKRVEKFLHPWFKGKITPFNLSLRTHWLNLYWREQIIKRDKKICQICFNKCKKFNVDHIVPFSQIINKYKLKTMKQAFKCKELWNIANGRILCIKCHKKTDTYGNHGYPLNKSKLKYSV